MVSQNTSNQLVAGPDVPSGLRSKAVYFVKTGEPNLRRDEDPSNVAEGVIFGDISPLPLDQLSTIIEEVFYVLS